MRSDVALPDGYVVRELRGSLYLFNLQGILLIGPTDVSTIEAYAWRDAWQQLDRELNEELLDLSTDTRPLHSLRRVRQYMRMQDAVAQIPRENAERRVRVLAALAAAIAAVFLIAALRIAGGPERAPRLAAWSVPAAILMAKHQAPAVPAEHRAAAAGTGRVASTPHAGKTPLGPIRAARSAPRRSVIVRYAVSFGEFASHAAAASMMHIIRSKGYIVYVATSRERSQVVTRTYRTRMQAERLVNALQEIGLPAQLTTGRLMGLCVVSIACQPDQAGGE